MRRSILTAFLSLAALGALADECPTGLTAKMGFVLERGGTTAEVRPAADHFVHVVNTYPNGNRQDVIYFGGLFVISRFDQSDRTINIPLSDLRAIFPLTLHARRAVTYSPARPGRVGTALSLEMTVIDEEKMRVGECSYRVLVIRNRSMNAEGRVINEETDLYAPELGFVLGKRYGERGGGQTAVQYQKIRVRGPRPKIQD